MPQRRGLAIGASLLLAAVVGAGATWGVLASRGPGRPVADTPADVSASEARIAALERDLAAARAAPRLAEGLAAPPPPAADARRATLERELAETKRRLEQAVAERDAALAAARGVVRLGGSGDDGVVVLGEGTTTTLVGPPVVPVDLSEAARLLRSDRAEDRRAAYVMLARTSDRDALGLLEEALGRDEDDVGSLAHPLMSRAAALKDRAWSAVQATGAPDTPVNGDNPTAWAPKQPEMGEVTIDLEYATAVRVDEVRIRETFNPGAVAKVLAFEKGRGWDVLWEGVAPADGSPRWFVPPVRRTPYATTTIRLVLDTSRVAGWNEIDAVELVGDGRRQWAQGAQASSSYAD